MTPQAIAEMKANVIRLLNREAELLGAISVLREASEKLLASKGYGSWTDEHIEAGLERAFAPEVLEEIRIVQLSREALRITNRYRHNSGISKPEE